jgi:hypothetical protein
MELSGWQRRLWVALWVGSASFTAGHLTAEWLYRKLTGRK